MDSSTESFVMGVGDRARRRYKQLHLRAFGGVSYGIGAYGSPIGNVTGVGNPPPVNPDQFGDQQTDQGADNGGMGDSGGGGEA